MHVPDGVLFHLAAVEYGEPGLSTTGGTTMGGGGGGGGPRMEGGGSRRRGEVETASRGGDRSKGEKLVLRIMLVNLVRLFHFTLSLLDFFNLSHICDICGPILSFIDLSMTIGAYVDLLGAS